MKPRAAETPPETLLRLRPGQGGRVRRLELPARTRADLARVGLTRGTEVLCLRRCPLGGPGLYRVRGVVLALRGRDAAGIRLAGACEDPPESRKREDLSPTKKARF